MQNVRVALFIDADNAPSRKIEGILAELAVLGVVSIRRAYGNWRSPRLESWVQVLHEHAIQPVQQFDLVKGKNATDMAMAIDAMDVLHGKPVEVFCLVSSDCDFTPLVTRLRADGKQVIGFGERKSPEPYVNACSRFVYLDDIPVEVSIQPLGTSASPVEAEEEGVVCVPPAVALVSRRSAAQLKGDSKLMSLLRNAVLHAADDDGWAPLGLVGSRIANQASFEPRNYGYSRLVDLFAAIDLFEVRRVGNHPQVRYKRRSPLSS
ncbi:NYN domain-containing protein [Pseudomonas stutzeri]|nr:NYN domain-containing protein [Stutzerimonas stutzeri]